MNSRNVLSLFLGFCGATMVLFSAWLSHQSEQLSGPVLVNLTIAVSFAFVHLLALAVALPHYQHHISAKLACYAFFIGIMLFSGSIIIKSFISLGLLASFTPVGGLAFVIGWLSLAIAIGKES